jgi:flavin reductase (DIM6/NTAB) family NADH-FMN oxidoreductase RutF
MLASWVMQSSFDPPMFTVAIKRGRYIADWVASGARVVLNILRDDEKAMLAHFGRGFEPGEDAFTGLELLDVHGAPVLREALAFLSGTVSGRLEGEGDHAVFGIKITDGRLLSDGAPMIHIRKNGLNY